MRIAYIVNSVEGGGAALPIPAITGVLRAAGAEVALFALERRDGRALPAIERAGLAARVRDGGRSDHGAALRWLDREIAAWRPTHLWTSLTRATLFGQLIGAWRTLPVASWQHAAWLRPANLRLLRATRRLTTLWIGDSASVTELSMTRIGIPDDRIATWPIFACDPAAPRARPWRPGETLRIGSLGRLHPVKGYDILIPAIASLGGSLPPVTLIIAGEGEQRAALAALAARHGVALELPGFTADPAAFLAGLHLYVQPSRSEGFCIALHEAMAAGLPVIASAVGELPRTIVAGASGLLVPAGDVAALADAVATACAMSATLRDLGAAARERVNDRFSAAAFRRAGEAALARFSALSPG